MNRATRRLTAFAIAVLFALMGVRGVFGLDACPRHDAPGVPTPAAPGASQHGHHGGAPEPGTPGHDGGCTCLGACHVDASPPLAAARASAATAPARGSPRAPAFRDAELPGPPAYLLPPAHGPPALT